MLREKGMLLIPISYSLSSRMVFFTLCVSLYEADVLSIESWARALESLANYWANLMIPGAIDRGRECSAMKPINSA